MDLDLRVAVGKYLRSTGAYVSNRVGAIVDIDFDFFNDHDWAARECDVEPRITIEFEYWDSQHVTHLNIVHDIEGGEELVKFLSVIARHK